MLGKLWKHEWKANCRLLLAVHLALLAMGLVGYLIQGILQTGPVTSVIGGDVYKRQVLHRSGW